jgi:hypothetical protein
MRQKLLFVADLGHFKCFRIVNDETTPQPRVTLLESFVPAGSHGKISDKLTDQAGRFRSGSGSGERHNIPLEYERRTIQLLSERIEEICRRQPELPLIYLAAHKEINRAIIDRLPMPLQNNIEKNLLEDLAKVPQTELLDHFRHAETPMAGAR